MSYTGYTDLAQGALLECPVCKKTFYCSNRGEWAYKRNFHDSVKIFCRWSCMRAFDREEGSQKKNGGTDK